MTEMEIADFCEVVVRTATEIGQLMADAQASAPPNLREPLRGAQAAARRFYQDMVALRRQCAKGCTKGQSLGVWEDDFLH